MIKFIDPRNTVKQRPEPTSDHKMKLFNVIIIHDAYVVAESVEAAREALKQFISTGELAATEELAYESKAEASLRESWHDQKPIVSGDVSDDDFERKVKGHTTLEIFKTIYSKDRP